MQRSHEKNSTVASRRRGQRCNGEEGRWSDIVRDRSQETSVEAVVPIQVNNAGCLDQGGSRRD